MPLLSLFNAALFTTSSHLFIEPTRVLHLFSTFENICDLVIICGCVVNIKLFDQKGKKHVNDKKSSNYDFTSKLK